MPPARASGDGLVRSVASLDMVTIKIFEQVFLTDAPPAEVEASVAKALGGQEIARIHLTNGAALYLNASMAVQLMDTGPN